MSNILYQNLESTEESDIIPAKNEHGLQIEFTTNIARAIVTKIADGMTLREVTSLPGMPSMYYVLRWRKKIPGFAEALDIALESRAHDYYDKIKQIAEDLESSKDEVSLKKFRFEAYKWLAEVDSPKTFTRKDTSQVNVGGNTFIIDTGIRREGDPGYIKDISLPVSEYEGAPVLNLSDKDLFPEPPPIVICQDEEDESNGEG